MEINETKNLAVSTKIFDSTTVYDIYNDNKNYLLSSNHSTIILLIMLNIIADYVVYVLGKERTCHGTVQNDINSGRRIVE